MRFALPFLVAAVALAAAAPAQASFHLIKVREIFPGTSARPDSDYVELQMYATGQSLVQFGELEVFNAAGAVTSTFTPGHSVTNAANQSTVLIADSEFSSQFPAVTADFTSSTLNLNPAGGAVCWPQTEPPFDDCASWGNFSGQGSLPSPGDSAPASPTGITNGMALLRSIAPGCSTLLEDADDTNKSSVDFSLATPAPRSNATAPSEHECAAVPDTALDTKPANPTNVTSAAFTYHAIPAAEASFECRLDGVAFAGCANSGITYPGPLAPGSHSFEVRAINTAGSDATPVAYTWTIDTTPPTATIQTHPDDPSPGATPAFTYQANELNSTFECRLSPTEAAFSSCPSTGKTYSKLANGNFKFEVRAIDPAGNTQTVAAAFQWTVDNSLADETPPQTTIVTRPDDPSASSTASFSYASNEPESSFECILDGAAFAACPAGGVTYTGLGNGSHSFQVRAIDPSGNKDLSPAGYSFQVVLAGTPLSISAAPPAAPLGPKPPETVLSKSSARTHDRTPTFRFSSSAAGASFQCKLDAGPYRTCRSPFTTKSLAFGNHTLKIRAVLGGVPDPTPAVFHFKVERQ